MRKGPIVRSRRGPTTWQRRPERDGATDELLYTIRHMLLLAGVSERTFAEWRNAELISAPAGRTRGARYGERQAHQALALANRRGKRMPTQAELLAHVIEVMTGRQKCAVPIGRGMTLLMDERAVAADARAAAFVEAVVHAFDRIYKRHAEHVPRVPLNHRERWRR